jgi:hypothetical protein
MKKILFLVCTFFLIHTTLFAETGQTVRGVVTDAFSGHPLIGASIIVVDSNPLQGTITDVNGRFELTNISIGRWSFACSAIGFQSSTLSNIMVVSGKETMLQFQLEEKITALGDVVVTSHFAKNKPINELALVSSRSFSVEETERYAGSLGDPARMVANYAGVVVGNDSRNDIIIRGNSPSGLLWRMEDVAISNPNHFGAHGTTGGPVTMLNSNLLANSDFMTGAFSAEYGNALSGVFDLNLRTGNTERFEGMGQVGFNGFELLLEGPIKIGNVIKNGSFIADYRFSTLQLMSLLGFDIGTGGTVPEYNDFSVIVDLPTTKIGRFKLIGLLGNSYISMGRSFDVDEAITHNQMGYATDFGAGLNIAMLTHTYMFDESTRIKSSLSFEYAHSITQSDSINYTEKKYFNLYAANYRENKWMASTQLKHRFNAKNNLTTGVSASLFVSSFFDSAYVKEYDKRITLTAIDKEQTILYNAYTNWQHKFSNELSVNTGLHYQLFNLTNESAIEPRVALRWQAHQKHAFSIGYGLHSQIQARTIYFYEAYNNNTDSYAQNNLGTGYTRSHHVVGGYDWHISPHWRVKTEAYYQDLFNVPVSPLSGSYSALNSGSGYYIANIDSLQNTGAGQNYGVELTLEKFLNKGYYGLMTVSLYDSKYQGYDKIWRNTAFNSNFAINLLGGYEWRIGTRNFLAVDLRSIWAGGMRYVPIDLAASIVSGEQRLTSTDIYTQRFNDYFRCDVRISFKQNLGKVSQEWGLDLQNVSNYKNIFAQQYNKYSESVAMVYQQGFMPMMMYRIHF